MNPDVALFHLVNITWGWDALAPFMKGVSNPVYFAPLVLVLIVWLGFRDGIRGRAVLLTALVLITATDQVSSHLLKPLIHRPRPCRTESGLVQVQTHGARCSGKGSFPSSHAANIAGLMILFGLRYRRWMIAALMLAFLVGYSRLYLGLHYPSDVLGGWALGGLMGWGAAWISSAIQKRWEAYGSSRDGPQVDVPDRRV